MKTRLHDIWAADRGALNGWVSTPSPMQAEMMALQDFDSITVDLQHGLIDYTDALLLLQTIHGHGKTAVARVPWNEPGIIMKLLDAGALGIICPMINTAADAKAFVGACQYAPRGYRSSGPTRAGLIYENYFPQANDSVVTLAMVETVESVANLDAILDTPHLTGIYVGPGDLAVSMGKPPALDHTDPEMDKAIGAILEKTKAKGLKCGIHCLEPTYMAKAIKRGFDFTSYSNDVRIFSQAVAGGVKAFRDQGGGDR
ncbi:MAG: aldolase/citrate lyase family protein [Alphaproteobacteria bacterium]|nr:aldolase/citrate lyase family protein [Alphaproteobacteria bacterium]